MLDLAKIATLKENEKVTINGVVYTNINGNPYKYVDDNSGNFISKFIFNIPNDNGVKTLKQEDTKDILSKLGTNQPTTIYYYGVPADVGGNLEEQKAKGIAREIKVVSHLKDGVNVSIEQLKEMSIYKTNFNDYIDIEIISDSKPSKKLVPAF